MQSKIVLIALVVSGCHVTPTPITANQSCNLPPNVWRQIDTPSNRDALLELPEQTVKRPVRESFVATSVQQEAWFEDLQGNLQACLYNPMKRMSCEGRDLQLVIFTRHESSWEAGPSLEIQCWDDKSAHNKPPKRRRAQEIARAS